IGIGRPAPGVDPAEYVLSAFTKDEVVAIGASVDRTVQALECLVIEGVEAAMNRFNIRDKQEGDE
ncbi:MAG: aminoacyl-tRNA hydrolase, partial [Nitrospirae bacterium]